VGPQADREEGRRLLPRGGGHEFLEELRKTAAEVAYIQTRRSEETDNAKAAADLALRGECSPAVFTSGVAVNAFFNSLDEGPAPRWRRR
jgi:uroporphyrinogen-III synthase